ncbi:MAG TPA: hypothetical protein VKE40_21390 [Gemmataceae bacterium]|nr:hypothetical protein [Gemmataceae bacterium]
MAYRDFTFPEVLRDLGLRLHDADLFTTLPAVPVRPEIEAFVREGINLALAIGTEKAKSEFIIAPVLLELRHTVGTSLSVFSGVEWNVDPARGLNGYCDFILIRGKSQFVMGAPYVPVVEAKNDNLRTGFGQCIAAMCAARIANERDATGVTTVHGVVSTGSAWKFLRLRADDLTMDIPEYPVENLGKIMGILRTIVGAG